MRAEVLLPLLLVGSAYAIGWVRLSRRAPLLVRRWRLALAFAGLTSVGLALLSPLDQLAHLLFSAHMVQHMLLMMVAPPLLLLADPLPMVLWGLPRSLRVRVGLLLASGRPLRRTWRALTWMPLAWLISAVTLWVWHWPRAYEAALRDGVLHDLEHLAFFGAGVLFWWPIISPAPRLHGYVRHGLRIVYVVLAEGQHALLGLLLSMSPEVLYASYVTAAPRLWDLSPLDDQAWGGIIMWATGGVVGLATVMVLLFLLFARETEAPLLVKTAETLGPR